jgi:hypothetical protein
VRTNTAICPNPAFHDDADNQINHQIHEIPRQMQEFHNFLRRSAPISTFARALVKMYDTCIGFTWEIRMMQIFGGLVLLTGIGLWVGNVSEAFCTFPMAGWVTIALGSALLRAGSPQTRAGDQESPAS